MFSWSFGSICRKKLNLPASRAVCLNRFPYSPYSGHFHYSYLKLFHSLKDQFRSLNAGRPSEHKFTTQRKKAFTFGTILNIHGFPV